MLDVLGQISTFLFQLLGEVFDLYTTCQILTGTFVLWILDRVFGIFDILKH